VGPWYILMDEFLVSGETIVRNLEMGLDRAAAFGGAMEVGYLPDMFGHIAQMPQILAQFGFDHAVVWRGTPSAVDRTLLVVRPPTARRCGPSTSRRATATAPACPTTPRTWSSTSASSTGPQGELIGGGPILWMNGTDHLVPSAHLGRVVAEANAIADDYDIAVPRWPTTWPPPPPRASRPGPASCAPVPGPTC
jgi:mannosylglycerate hydrolase